MILCPSNEEYWSLDQTQPVCKPAGLLTKTEVDGGREDLQGLLNRWEDFLTSKNIFLFNSKWHLQFIKGCRLTKTEVRRNSEGSFNTGERQEYTTEMWGVGRELFLMFMNTHVINLQGNYQDWEFDWTQLQWRIVTEPLWPRSALKSRTLMQKERAQAQRTSIDQSPQHHNGSHSAPQEEGTGNGRGGRW